MTPDYSLSDTSASQPQSVEGEAVTSAEVASLPLALLARDTQKMRAAAQLLNAWQITPHDLWCGALLGKGGQADVFAGRWEGLPVAIKKQRSEHRMTPAAQRSIEQMVRREVRALTRVRHPNVVRLFGACMEPTPCIVMAHARGGSLEEALREGRFVSVPDMVTLLAGIARGMEAVHAHKVIHLDLKPANVLLGPKDVPWVTDFGLSTSSNVDSLSNSSAGGRGTLYYKAPEMFAFPPHVSASADVYAYAILAWMVATGEDQPYRDLVSADTAMAAMLAQGVRPELPSGDWRESTTAGLANLIEACWAQTHGERPAFGGAKGVVERIDALEGRLLKKDADATVETMLTRVWVAESEKAVVVTLLEEYEAAGAEAKEELKAELEEEKEGLQTTRAGAEASSAAAQSFLREGGHHELLQQIMTTIQQMSHSLEAVKKDVRSTTVTLGSLAMDELDCPRLVFIMPHAAEQRTFTQRLKSVASAAKHRLVFLDPVTGSAVPCGADGKGYVLTLPSDFLRKHAAKLSDGLKVVKLVLAIGGCSGLPGPWFDLCSGLSTEVISKEEARAVEAFEAMLDSAASSAEPAEGTPSRLSKYSRNAARKSNVESAATGSAYRALKLLVESMCGDPALLRCGLEKAWAEDGTVEWVAPESRERFLREGADCLIWNRRGS